MMIAEVLKHQAESKEKELRDFQSHRIDSLEKAFKEITTENDSLKKQFDDLKTDFIYNFELLEERDKELSNFDKKINELGAYLKEKDILINELKIKNEEFKNSIVLEKNWTSDMKNYFETKLKERDLNIEQFKSDKEKEIEEERREMELFKRNLERKIVEMQEEISLQDNDLKEYYEENRKKREHEHRLEIDQLKNQLFTNDLKVRMLTKQLDILREARECGNTNLQTVQLEYSELEKNLIHKDYELQDIKAMTSVRILELEEKLINAEKNISAMNFELAEKIAEIDSLNELHKIKISKYEDNNKNLEIESQNNIKMLKDEIAGDKQKIKFQENNLKKISEESQIVIQKLNNELEKIHFEHSSEINKFSLQQTQNDLEMNKMTIIISNLREEIDEKNKDILKYQDEIAKNLNIISTLNHQNKQLYIDFQHQLENKKFKISKESEKVIKELSDAKNEAQSRVYKLQQQLDALQKYSSSLIQEKDDLKEIIAKNTKITGNEENVIELQKENDELKQVVKMMRHEMEDILQTSDRQELEDLKIKYESLQNQYKNLEKMNTKNNDDVNLQNSEDNVLESNIKDNMQIAAHVENLNKQIGELRKEKMALTSQICKQQSRILHVETLLNSEESKKRQTELEQLQYEHNSLKRRSEFDQLNLKHRIEDLELQLVEAQNEADEFYKANVEANNEITHLSNQISRLKLDTASKNQQIGFGAQELVIQQLHDELKHIQSGHGVTLEPEENPLKLQQALDLIRELQKEKQILIELSNKLKAQLKTAKHAIDKLRGARREIKNYIIPEKLNVNNSSKYELKDKNISSDSYKQSGVGSVSTFADESIGDVWKILESNESDIKDKNILKIPTNDVPLFVKGMKKTILQRHSYHNIPGVQSSTKANVSNMPSKHTMLQQRIQTYTQKK